MQPNFERRETKEFQMVSSYLWIKVVFFLEKSRSNIQVQAPQIAGKLENILQSLKISVWVRMVSRQLWVVSPGGNKAQTEAQLSAQRICLCKEES